VKRPAKKKSDKFLHQLISEIAKSENIPIKDVQYILQYTYAWLSEKIRQGNGEGIRIPYWGAIAVKPKNKKRLDVRIANEKSGAENKRKSVSGERGEKADPSEEERNNKD
jgi:hypothetical protein